MWIRRRCYQAKHCVCVQSITPVHSPSTMIGTGSMASILQDPFTPVCIFILSLEMVIGISSATFILGAIVIESSRKKSMKTGNKIRIALYISNACYSFTMFAGAVGGFLEPSNNQITFTLAYVTYSVNMFTMSSSSWLTAILSVFYAMKITDFQAGALVWLKKNIKAVIPWVILGVEVFALFSSFFGVLLFINPYSSSMNNSTLSRNNSVSTSPAGFLSISLTLSCAPFPIIAFSSYCIAKVLSKHHRSIAESMSTSDSKKTKNFENVVSRVMRIILIYMFFYLCVLLYYVATLFNLRVEIWVFLIIMSSFNPLMSLLIIVQTPELRKIAKEMLNCMLCRQ